MTGSRIVSPGAMVRKSKIPALSKKVLSFCVAASSQILAKDPNATISPFSCMSSASSVVLMNLLPFLNLAPRMIKVGRRGIFEASATTSRLSPFRQIQIRRCLSKGNEPKKRLQLHS